MAAGARKFFAHLCVYVALGVAGCTIKPPSQSVFHDPPPVLPPPPVPQRVDSEAFLPWASNEPVFVVVDLTCRLLRVYRYGHLQKTYSVVLGRSPGRKLYAGDKRTPVGLYMITGKAPHRKWTNFMLLDYPTESDVHRYWQQVAFGQVPRQGDRYPGVGSEIGIHGTDKEHFNRLGINWTLGCVSLLNHDMRELYRLAPVGTLVYIKE